MNTRGLADTIAEAGADMAETTCSIPDCERPHIAKGYCHTHYKRWRRHGDPLLGAAVRRSGPCSIEGCKASANVRNLCMPHYQAEYRVAHRVKARATAAQWRAENPGRHRANNERWRNDPDNQRKARAAARAWRIANPDRRSEQARLRYALKRSGLGTRVSTDLLAAKLAYWGWRCWIAGPTCTVVPVAWDHVKPLTKGGPHLLANLRPACAPCNAGKHNHWPYPTRRQR